MRLAALVGPLPSLEERLVLHEGLVHLVEQEPGDLGLAEVDGPAAADPAANSAPLSAFHGVRAPYARPPRDRSVPHSVRYNRSGVSPQ